MNTIVNEKQILSLIFTNKLKRNKNDENLSLGSDGKHVSRAAPDQSEAPKAPIQREGAGQTP